MDRRLELIATLGDATRPSRVLDGQAFRILHDGPGTVWNADFAEDGVWHLRDADDHVAWSPPPPYTTSTDAVLQEIAGKARLAALRQLERADANRHDPEWREWTCVLAPVGGWIEEKGRGATAAMAILDALMRLELRLAEKSPTGAA